MKNYKEYARKNIGDSDIARLTLSSPEGVYALEFNIDALYEAYICDDELDINSFPHYQKVWEATNWLSIFDDYALTKKFKADKITVFRAGDMGCIIHLQGNGEDVTDE